MLIPWEKIHTHTHTHTQNYAHLDSILLSSYLYFAFGSDGKASVYNVGDPGSVPGLGRSPGEGKGNPHQYLFLENPMDGGAYRLQSMGSQRVGHD